MVKSVLAAIFLAACLILSPQWVFATGLNAENGNTILAQNTCGSQNMYGYDYNQMHNAYGDGCGGWNHGSNYSNTWNYQQNPYNGYQYPYYPYSDPYYRDRWNSYQSGGVHHHY